MKRLEMLYKNVVINAARYRWCHDSVLRELAHTLEQKRTKKHPEGSTGFIFVK